MDAVRRRLPSRRCAAVAVLPAVLLVVVALAMCASASSGRAGALGLVRIADGFAYPLQVVVPPGGARDELYVVQQAGLVRVLKGGKIQPKPFLDVRRLITAGGEQGLLGLAFAPDYVTSRQFVVDYTDRNGDTRIVRYRSNGTRALPASARQLLFVDQPYPNHNGGMVAYGRDGMLYVGMGDGGSGGDPENRAQNPSSLLGKILKLDPRRPGAKPSLAVLGVRNPWRFSFDRANGDLWVGDVGQNADRGGRSRGLAAQGPPQLRLGRLRGQLLVRAARSSGPAGSSRRSRSTATRRDAPSPAATSTAGPPCRRPSAGTSTATTAREPSGRSSSRTASRGTCARSRSRSKPDVVRRGPGRRALPGLRRGGCLPAHRLRA